MRYVGVDIESTGLKGFGGIIWSLQLDFGDKSLLFHDCNGMRRCPPEARKFLEDPTWVKVIQSSEFDAPYIELILGIKILNIEDTRLQEQVIQGLTLPRWKKGPKMPPFIERMYKAHSSSLKYMLPRYGLPEANKSITVQFVDRPRGIPFTKKELEYMRYDAKILLPIRSAQQFILERDGLWEVAMLENRVAEVVADMKVRGLGFDSRIWKQITLDNEYQAGKILRTLPNKVNNWNSPPQVKAYFKSIGIDIPTFDDLPRILERTNNSTLKVFMEWRDLMIQISKYGLSWLGSKFVDPDGRIRCQWEQIVDTGRFAVQEPPIHGLPKKGNHRSAFIPRKGHRYVIGDYTGQEIGVMAAKAKEKIWIDALLREDDVHALTASIVFKDKWLKGKERGCTFPKKCKCKAHLLMRHDSKTLNYMLAYGGGIGKFMAETGYDKIKAAGIIGRHNRAIPSVIRWLDRNAQESLKTGVSFSADPYRRRRVLTDEKDWKVINQGKNNPVQAAGANMVKLAMISFPWKKYPIVFVWHDEIIVEVPTKEAPRVVKILKDVMEKSANYITGVEGLVTVYPRIAGNLMKEG